jgi:hypothetical protein
MVADEGFEKAAAAGEQLVEYAQRAEAVPWIPAGIGWRDFALRLTQLLLENERAGYEVTNFKLLDERPWAQAPFPGCKRH